MLSGMCESRKGRELVETMSFSSDFSEVQTRLRRVDEMLRLISAGEDMPAPVYFDIEPRLMQLRTDGTYMDAEQLVRLLKTMRSMREVRAFYCRVGGDESKPLTPALSEVFSPLLDFPALCTLIERTVDKFGRVADNASEGLLKVRRALAAAQGAVQRAMRRAMERAVQEGVIDKDTSPAVRDGRMVIPVAAGAKRSIGGIVHDESATGKTVFIEPTEVVESSNRLRQLEMEEQREVIAVLVDVAAQIRPSIPDILFSLDILAHLDFITAKARLAREVGGNMPVLERGTEIDWFHAVHPVLLLALRKQDREVIPLDLNLSQKQRFLIVSGPNAGGKSVVLKTVGIVQYMTQCGLLPTLNDNSHVGIFGNIFVDIGDEQSIENDLSTYSSHLRNMKFFMAHADAGTLVLADEMGSGTEPQIGGALAQAILARLAQSRCFGVVTTHYQNLKTFADEQEGFVNGAMVYDRQHLRPTFRLAVGNPGSSFALEIARNIGLPRDVIDGAKEIVGSDYVNLDKYLLDIDRDRRYWNNKRQNIKEKEARLNALLEKYEDTSADLRERRKEILHDARRQAEEILAGANARIEATIREIRDVQAEKERTRNIRRELQQYRDQVRSDAEADAKHEALKPLKHKSRRPKENPKAETPAVTKPLAVGHYVKMSGGGVVGRILSISGNRAEVAFGGLRTFVKLDSLKHSSAPVVSAASQKPVLTSSTTDDSRRRQLNFKQDIDVRGMRADEALQAVMYFIDDAVQFGAGRVRILHGTGQGILKTVIRDQLRANPAVHSYADEDVRFGGAGITVVDL